MTIVLIVLNVLATAMIFTATITPGWLCLDNYLDDTKMSGVALDMNAFYSRVCGYDSDTCSVVPFLDYRSNSRLSSVAIEGRFTEYLVESILTILCTTIGCFLTVVYVLRRRNQHNMHDLRHTTSKLTNAGGLCLSIVGALTCVLIGLSLSAAAIILTATTTPGWLCLDVHLDYPPKTIHITMDFNVIYSRHCVIDNDTCVHVVSFQQYESNSRLSSFGRLKEHFVEGIFTILCTTIGCFLTVAHVLSVSRRKQNNSHNLSSTNSKSANGGLFLSIVGGFCGLILMIEFIILNTVFGEMENNGFNIRMEKRFPYSIVIICVGILLQVIVVIRFGKSIKAPRNEDRESIALFSP